MLFKEKSAPGSEISPGPKCSQEKGSLVPFPVTAVDVSELGLGAWAAVEPREPSEANFHHLGPL